ncbi:formylglycine-generating enzyme family protein [Actinokineospora terrae]|uniref:Formylglycine-generating enzyme, required for sulfatase activity, contains SUMF1/FGE domain n=1 Tax=Actinokineospora terrae TaxID=155974 RepID=A0A1H9MFL5_9PSEU|nr:formylglycine-generating enzyme family protein [Actinokineospora terrae]SER22472.1 Formylglycine-generating enzyme, required for sulfatase activity, contains SUMF1/FGE domain [Actinokineospora terrae]
MIARREGMVWIGAGTFAMGSDEHYPEEAPVHEVAVAGFWIDRTTVTNRDFARFVTDTGHVTVAERAPDPSDYPDVDPCSLVPASVVFVPPPGPVDMRDNHNWWHYVPGANWRRPAGLGSSIRRLLDHPVVHLAWDDAVAYAAWAGKDIPTEAEWEYAARGGLDRKPYSWGDELTPGGAHMANTWQGPFPYRNTVEDRFTGTAPVGSFPANDYGLHDMIGNVWEWTSDWYAPHSAPVRSCCSASTSDVPRRVVKGGSFLCAPDYCRRYRPAARMGQPVDTSTCHLGLRLVARP